MKTVGFVSSTSGFTDEERELRRRIYQSYLGEGLHADVRSMPTGPTFFDHRDNFGEAIGRIADFVKSLDPAEYDVLVWAGAIDPGLGIARAHTKMPVVGPGESAMSLAAMLGRRLSVVTVDEHAVSAVPGFLANCPVKPPIASVRSIDVPVRQIVDNRSVAVAAVQRECRAAVREDGAESIYLGAMTLGSLDVADSLRTELGVPVFDPMRVAAGVAATIAAMVPASD
jgi:allantoin racemase